MGKKSFKNLDLKKKKSLKKCLENFYFKFLISGIFFESNNLKIQALQFSTLKHLYPITF